MSDDFEFDERDEKVSIDNRKNWYFLISKIQFTVTDAYMVKDVFKYRDALKNLFIKVNPYLKKTEVKYLKKFNEVDRNLTNNCPVMRSAKITAFYKGKFTQAKILAWQILEEIEMNLTIDMQKAKLLLPVSDLDPSTAIERME